MVKIIPGLGVAALPLLIVLFLSPRVASAREITGVITHAVGKDTLSKVPLSCGRIDEPWPDLRVQTPSFLERIDWTERATDDEGRFSFQADADGRWIIVTRDSHYTFPRGYVVVTLGPGESPAPLDLVVCDGARREVSVFGPDGRTPLDHPENVRLVMDPTNPEIRPDMYVVKPAHELPLARIVGKYQGDGVVVLGPAPPGYYELYSTPDDGFRFAKVDQRVDRSLEGAPLQWKEWRKRTLRCMPVPLLQAKFILPDGRPAAGAEANLLTQPNWMNGLRTDANGVLRFDQDEQLPLGNVRVSLPGYAGVFRPEQFSTDPTAAPWMLEVDSTTPAEGKVVLPAEVTQDAIEETAQAPGQTVVVKDCQGFPLADALVSVRPMENSPEKVPAMTLRSDAEGRVKLPFSTSEYVFRIAHEAYAERVGLMSIQDEGWTEDMIPFEVTCAGKLTVSVMRGLEGIDNASVNVIPELHSAPPVQCDLVSIGTYRLNRAEARPNIVWATITEELGESSFLYTRYIGVDVPVHREINVTIDLSAGSAEVILNGDTSNIEALVFHLKGKNPEEFDVYRWNRETESIAPRLFGLRAETGNVYIDYGESGFDYLPVSLLNGEVTSIPVGQPDMVTARYKLESPGDLSQKKITLSVRPTGYMYLSSHAILRGSPAAAGGAILATTEMKRVDDLFVLRVPRNVELSFLVEETWKDSGLQSRMQGLSSLHEIGYFALKEDDDLNVLESSVEAIVIP